MKTKRIIGMIGAAAAGLAAAIALTVPAVAGATTPDELPGLGYHVSELNLGSNCHDWSASGYGASEDIGSDCDPGFQAALDDFVNRTCPCRQTTATTTTAPATQETTTAQTTTTEATLPAATEPATTTTDAIVTEAAPAATSPAAPVTAPDTTGCDVQCQIRDLQAQIDALRSQLVRLVQILQQWPGIDPGILAQLMTVTP